MREKWFPAPWPAELLSVLRSARSAFVGVAAASMIVNVLMLTAPLFMLQVYDRVLPSRSVPTLVGLLLIAVVLFLIQAAVDAIRSRLLIRVAELFDAAMRERLFDAVQHDALTNARLDNLQLVRDLDTVRGYIGGTGLIAFCDLPWAPFYIVVCWLFHPLMGVAVAIGVLALCGVTVATEMFTRKPAKDLVGLGGRRRLTTETAYRNAETVHALGMHRRMRMRWSEQSLDYLATQRHLLDLSTGFGSVSRLLRTILQSGVLALGAYLVVNQQATAGVMLAATILSIRALSPIELAIGNWRGFIAARESFARLCAAIAALPSPTQRTELPVPSKQITVGSVSVTVPSTGAVVLHDITFMLTAGQALAIVGPSGSGKSALGRALVGAWPVARGAIRIDGATLPQWEFDRLGRSIGYLSQDVSLFRGTVADNIARFAEDRCDQRLIAAAKAADIHEMVLRLPQGYETEVGEGGLMLSGGQRQRVALARALYGDPFLLVLDEPNSNLDAAGEQALARAISAARARGAIVIVIAHRPSLLSVVDHVLVLNDGRMQAFGKVADVLPMLMPKPQPPRRREPAKDAAKEPVKEPAKETAKAATA
ncbi:type I secretion protein [Afipia sp. P52-10]|uniref:type I secretion system permease/ATPase n=1 Tax=Afipia sp. P52-10 TaxID=1429916 RepID=UPI0003DF22FF|nr:type I secretion system permease/ATPase [Afipia sp. P52-10]ETR78467.1 type I secretion protein [Afipia sp. P52-10]